MDRAGGANHRSRDAPLLRGADIWDQALETSNELGRIGLSGDRLSRDLTRIFKLSQN
jgi:hypothetical protein